MSGQKKLVLFLISLIIIIAVLLILSEPAFSQAQPGNHFWFNLGLGSGTVGDNGGVSFLLNPCYQNQNNLWSFRLLFCGELFGKSLNDYGIMYGRVLHSTTLFVSAGAGVALVDGKISHGLFSGEETQKINMIPGVPMEVQLFWRPLSFIGLGLYGFANLNNEESFSGVAVTLQAGGLR